MTTTDMQGKDGILVDKLVRKRGISIQKACSLVPGSCWVPGPKGLDVNIKESAYDAFYRWLVVNRDAPVTQQAFHRLHNIVVVGVSTMKYLNSVETMRLRATGLRGEELKRAVSFSNINAGPQELIGSRRIAGNVVLIRPDA